MNAHPANSIRVDVERNGDARVRVACSRCGKFAERTNGKGQTVMHDAAMKQLEGYGCVEWGA